MIFERFKSCIWTVMWIFQYELYWPKANSPWVHIYQISLQHNFICWNCTGKKYTCEELVKGHWTFFISLYEYNLTVFRSFSNQYYKQAGLQCILIKGVKSVKCDINDAVFLNFQPWASLWNQAKWCLC